MNKDLLQLPTRQLLNKIGAGDHIPGSGSAAALNGILSCKLLLTVIELTHDPTKPKRLRDYALCKKEFEQIKKDISDRISLRLETLFEEDSQQFDQAIQKRNERDNEKNQGRKNDLHNQSLRELKKSTEIPIEIASLCIQLAKYSTVVFDRGFKSARGDAGVALGSSLSGLTGCISIISLNLQSFPKNIWSDSIHIQKRELRKAFDSLSKENLRLMDTLDSESVKKGEFLNEFLEIRKSLHGKARITHEEIETLARRIQNALWEYRNLIWVDKTPTNLLGVVKSEKVIKLLKYAFHKVHTMGVNERNEQIAGIIDNKNYSIKISTMFKPEIVNFTTAHELGHALLHDKIELHRDLPLDGSDDNTKVIEEMQADKFAAFFLMPKKIVMQLFYQLFQVRKFKITKETAQMLNNSSVYELRKKIKNRRELSQMITKCEYYNFKSFTPLSRIFQVSTEAMAIRLEELDLVEF
jgi:formiminotetrahydrofolate cyclodeaminase/Zn-dependent peptidase ImmA (M78 family)